MRPSIAVGFKACCFTVGLMLANVQAADSAPSLMGLTREQAIERLGEPRSAIVAAGREVLFFERERLVLRDGVVVEIEALPVEPPRRPAPARSTAKQDEPTEEPAVDGASTPSRANRDEPEENTREKSETEAPADEAAPRPPEPSLSIKSVRPPTGTYTRPPPKKQDPTAAPATTPPAPSAPATKAPANAAKTPAPSAPAVAPATGAAATGPRSGTVPTPPVAQGIPAVTAETPSLAPDEALANQPAVEAPAVAPAAKKKRSPRAEPAGAEADEFAETAEQIFTTRTYLIALLTIGGGIGYLVWRRRQRELELAATAVSRTPFESPKSTGTGARFTAEQLGKLEWKRFEELVAAYYNKTGVVAARTKSGPKSPVHIKISWKGESRPFACVQCLSHVTGLIDVKPLQDLVAVLAAEDIRRGYVVTTGKFGVAARDFAEEKHITLMPGDIFLEKLNALPDAARAEVMQELATGDLTTPSCPKCEAKMVRSPDDPSVWRCATHPDQTIAGR